MNRSLNEIEQTVRKAVRGCGYPWGVADEAGKAVRVLHEYRIDGVDLVASALDLFGFDDASEHTPVALDGAWHARSGRLDPLIVGPSLRDHLGGGAEVSLELADTAYPGLLAGYLCMFARERDCRITIGWDALSLTADGRVLGLEGDFEQLYAAECVKALCSLGAGQNPGKEINPIIGEVTVDDHSWAAVERYAHRTYVKATDASRMAGAGAGLVDND